MIYSMKKDRYLEILYEIGADDHCSDRYCIYREILKNLYMEPRTLVQFKCIEKIKYEKSNELGYDIGFDEAGKIWVEMGYAEIFADCYDPNLKVNYIYNLVKSRLKKEEE